MEAGLALPIISLPTQGDRLPGALGPLLLLALLPLGYVSVLQIRELRDPSWRLLAAIGVALLTRLVVATVPDPGPPGVAVWLGRSFVPAAVGVALAALPPRTPPERVALARALRASQAQVRQLRHDLNEEISSTTAYYSQLQSQLRGFKPFRECRSIQDAFNVYDSMEGRALAAEERLSLNESVSSKEA